MPVFLRGEFTILTKFVQIVSLLWLKSTGLGIFLVLQVGVGVQVWVQVGFGQASLILMGFRLDLFDLSFFASCLGASKISCESFMAFVVPSNK